jgi:hypothetical protein
MQDDDDGENTACDEFAIGHFCEDIKAPFVEEGHDSASMTYDGGFNSGFSAVRSNCAQYFIFVCSACLRLAKTFVYMLVPAYSHIPQRT